MNILRRHHEVVPKKRLLSRNHIIALVAVVIVGTVSIRLIIAANMPAQRIDTSKYQVVYLANGQAYFGKLQNTRGQFLVVKDPYTMQAIQAEPEQASADTAAKSETSTTLIKVSGQVYGPEDSIALRAEQVTFWQNLRDDSKVTQAIQSKK